MGLFSFFRKSDNYEEILAALDADIKKAEKRRVKTQQQAQRWLTIWTMYTLLLWVVYSVGFWLYGWPMRHNMSGLTLTASITSVLGGPFFIYYSRKIIRAWFRQSLERQGKKIEQLMSEQKEKIRELKEKTKYDKTKNLIDRYESPKDKKQQQGPILLGNPAATIVAPGDKVSRA
ncbi:hypothetical protein EV182_003886 [Spiromyces aspiralis]|uniref:Uncharacterized protein n=1 Tax=Spiromyces aspiralis TaxID=68401 RepID=A0ACC1HGB7_9FUNG|nr:hypothetical protein EV182_003886 [Spiromyces aspiralis]